MEKTICCICGNEYWFDEEDTPSDFSMVCSQGCKEQLEQSSENIKFK